MADGFWGHPAIFVNAFLALEVTRVGSLQWRV
jgi:hypothetical protein